MRTAAKTEPDIAEMRGHLLASRRDGMLHFVRALAAHAPAAGGAQPGSGPPSTFSRCPAGSCSRSLTDDLEWSGEAYETWLAETLIATLLA